jgi:hypothetical protein
VSAGTTGTWQVGSRPPGWQNIVRALRALISSAGHPALAEMHRGAGDLAQCVVEANDQTVVRSRARSSSCQSVDQSVTDRAQAEISISAGRGCTLLW